MFRTLALIATVSACGKDAPSPATKVDPHAPAAATATGRKPCDHVKRADAEKAVGMALPDTDENVTTNEVVRRRNCRRTVAAIAVVG